MRSGMKNEKDEVGKVRNEMMIELKLNNSGEKAKNKQKNKGNGKLIRKFL